MWNAQDSPSRKLLLRPTLPIACGSVSLLPTFPHYPCYCIDSVLENTLLAHVVYVHAQAAMRWPNENGSICLSSASVRPNHERALK